MKIHQSDTLDYTPALQLALTGALELLKAGFGPQRLVFTGSVNVIWIEEPLAIGDGKLAVACICYVEDLPNKRIWIFLSYVLPGWRRKGLFKKLFKYLEKIAKAKKLKYIESGVHPDNKVMIAAAKAQGRISRAIEYAKEL